jgi:hypothetical protein
MKKKILRKERKKEKLKDLKKRHLLTIKFNFFLFFKFKHQFTNKLILKKKQLSINPIPRLFSRP